MNQMFEVKTISYDLRNSNVTFYFNLSDRKSHMVKTLIYGVYCRMNMH